MDLALREDMLTAGRDGAKTAEKDTNDEGVTWEVGKWGNMWSPLTVGHDQNTERTRLTDWKTDWKRTECVAGMCG